MKMLRLEPGDNLSDVEDLLRRYDVTPRRVNGLYSVLLTEDGQPASQEEMDAKALEAEAAPATLSVRVGKDAVPHVEYRESPPQAPEP